MPSLSEGLPVVGLQALAMGLAIVASRAGGNIDLVEPGYNGFWLTPMIGKPFPARCEASYLTARLFKMPARPAESWHND